jgi:hypothetical protein
MGFFVVLRQKKENVKISHKIVENNIFLFLLTCVELKIVGG